MVFAGTFDRLHEGHRHLLRTALRLGQHVAIGLTTDRMVSWKKDAERIQSYEERRRAVEAFLREECPEGRWTVFPIDTVEGGADKMADLEALVVSDEISVVKNAFAINELRERNGLRRFHIVVVPRVRTRDGRPLSSSRLRRGEVFSPDDLTY